jgi:heme iron utilization protein
LTSPHNSDGTEKKPDSIGSTCRALIRSCDKAALATVDRNAPDQPYASLVMIACRPDGVPIMLLSDLAEHTQNIKHNHYVSLLMDDTANLDDALTGARVTVQGVARRSDDSMDRQRFLHRHPTASDYADFGDFSFYQINGARTHLVAGFGKIHWIDWEHVRFNCNDYADLIDAEAEIIAHMNNDHLDAVQLYAQLAGAKKGNWNMTGIDPEGIDLRAGGTVLRLKFETMVSNSDAARSALAGLAKQARAVMNSAE